MVDNMQRLSSPRVKWQERQRGDLTPGDKTGEENRGCTIPGKTRKLTLFLLFKDLLRSGVVA